MLLKTIILILAISIPIYVFTAMKSEGRWKSREKLENRTPETSPSATYSKYDEDDGIIMSRKNAGNIEYLKERVNETEKYGSSIAELKKNVELMQDQINAIAQQQADFAVEIAGDTPLDISGTN